MKLLLEGKKVFVTGGSRGIGKSICTVFAQYGADIAFNYHSTDEKAAEVLDIIDQSGRRGLKFKGSVDDLQAVRIMFKETAKEFGGLDILVNNAGTKRDGFFIMMSDDAWNEVLSVNLKGVFYCCREAAKIMMRKKSGAIINISSLTGEIGQPGQANYAASKGGVISFTKSIAKELAKSSIRVNCITPGFIETEMLYDVPDNILESNKESIPLKRFGSAEEVANTALFLASDLSAYITGEVVKVNGGLFM